MFSTFAKSNVLKNQIHPRVRHYRQTDLYATDAKFNIEQSYGDRVKASGPIDYDKTLNALFKTEIKRMTNTLPKTVLYSHRFVRPRKDLLRPNDIESFY